MSVLLYGTVQVSQQRRYNTRTDGTAYINIALQMLSGLTLTQDASELSILSKHAAEVMRGEDTTLFQRKMKGVTANREAWVPLDMDETVKNEDTEPSFTLWASLNKQHHTSLIPLYVFICSYMFILSYYYKVGFICLFITLLSFDYTLNSLAFYICIVY